MTSALPRGSRAGIRLPVKLAVRAARRSLGRSILIVTLIAIPVVGLAGATTVVLTMTGTAPERAQAPLGHMAASLTLVGARVYAQNEDGSSAESVGGDSGESPSESSPPSEWVPAKWRIVPLTRTALYLRTAHGVGQLSGISGRTWDSAFRGRFSLVSGRAPTSKTQLLVSPAALSRLGVRVGGEVRTADGKDTYTVVGTMRDLTQPSSAETLFGIDAAFPPVDPTDISAPTYYLDGPPVGQVAVAAFNRHGATVVSTTYARHPRVVPAAQRPSDPLTIYALYGGIAAVFALFEVALLAGAAFMVGAREQQRSLAVIASVGADRRLLSRSVAFGGIVLGMIGAAVGVALGIAGAAVWISLTGDGSITKYYGFDPNPLPLAAIAVIAIGAAWTAAAIPGRSASKFDIVSALRGARRPAKPSRVAPVVGAIVALAGTALAVIGGLITLAVQTQNPPPLGLTYVGPALIAVGSIAAQLGLTLAVPLILRLVARVTNRAGTGARLASRDLARNSGRSVPAIAAVMSTVFLAAFLMAGLGGAERYGEINYQWQAPLHSATIQLPGDNPVAVVPDADGYLAKAKQILHTGSARLISGAADVEEYVPASGKTRTKNANPYIPPLVTPRVNAASRCVYSEGSEGSTCSEPQFLASTGSGAHLVVGDADDLATLLGHRPTAADLRALEGGGAVSLYPNYVERGRVTFDWWTQAQLHAGKELSATATPERQASVTAVVDQPEHPVAYGVVISPSTAASLGITPVPRTVLAPLKTTPSTAQQDALNAYLASRSTGASGTNSYLSVEYGPSHFAGGIAWIVLAIAGLLTLGASIVSLGLARLDGKRDEYTLGSVGAPPRTLRAMVFWQAIELAGLGSFIGSAIALVPAYALSLSGTFAFDPPWAQLVLGAVAVPLVIAIATALTRRSPGLTLERPAIG